MSRPVQTMKPVHWRLLETLDIEEVGVRGLEDRFTIQQMREILVKWGREDLLQRATLKRQIAGAILEAHRDKQVEKQIDEEEVLRGKWLMDGAKTLDEAAKLLEDEARRLRVLAAEGYKLEGEIADDYGTIVPPSDECED